MKFGFVIPVYNHGSTLEFVVSNLDKYNFPMIVVDDGNDLKNKEYISDIAEKYQLSRSYISDINNGRCLRQINETYPL